MNETLIYFYLGGVFATIPQFIFTIFCGMAAFGQKPPLKVFLGLSCDVVFWPWNYIRLIIDTHNNIYEETFKGKD